VISATRELFVAIGVDCDPDRDTYPRCLRWRGVEALTRLFDIADVRWTLNVRADTQIRQYCGSAAFCWEQYNHIWRVAEGRGHSIAWHLHYFGADGKQDVSESNIIENIEIGSAALGGPDIVHMGWTFQNEFSLRHLARAGVRIDYSPVPRMRFTGHRGVDAYDWSAFSYRPQRRHGVQMIPAFSAFDPVLSRRFRTERVMLTTTTRPILYRRLLDDFFSSGADFFVSYFHADEIAGAVGGWRSRHLYSLEHLHANLRALRERADRAGYVLRFVTIRELAAVLFDEDRTSYA